jgi:diguanylate cyclase (GGDEF)-like protein
MKAQPTTTRSRADASLARPLSASQGDGLGFYRLLAGISALSTFRAKVTAVVLFGAFVPAFLLVFAIVVGAGRMSAMTLIVLVIALGVAGVAATLWALWRLLLPLDIASQAIDDVALERPLARVDLPGSDAAAQIMRGVQALVARNETLAAEARRERDRDELTGLLSRRAGRERAQALIDRETRRGRTVRVLIADVNAFSSFNAEHGTGHGDALLKVVGERLARVAGDDGLAIRWHGDAFLLVQVATPDEETGPGELLGRPIVVKGSQAPLTLSLGTAQTEERTTIDALVASAEAALARIRER